MTPLTLRRAGPIHLVLAAMLAAAAVGLTPRSGHADPPVSPLLWGENLALNSGSGTGDWFLGSAALRNALQAAHTQIIRMPVRGPNPDAAGWANEAEFKAAAGYVRQLGMMPLVILRNPEAPRAGDTDLQVVDYVTGVFGDQPVSYEFGNETDLDDGTGNYVTAASYVSHWNQVVPALRAHAGPAARFLGPVSYQYDDSYLRTFLAGAQPRPDAISWHMYTCGTSEPEDACLNAGGLDDWPAHFAQARAATRATIGVELPIWITEWNFNPASDLGSDPKRNDPAFLRAWTVKALRTLADSGVTAAMHYNVEGLVPLATAGGALTAQGQAFKDEYEALVGGAAPTPTSPPPATSGPPSGYSFEDGGIDGWTKTGNVSSYTNSTEAGGQDGQHALKVTFQSSGASDLPYLHANPTGGPSAGQTLSAYLYLPAGPAAQVTAKLYIQDAADQWHTGASTTVTTPGQWVRLAYTPAGYTGPAKQIGVQFGATPYLTATTFFLDSVNWS